MRAASLLQRILNQLAEEDEGHGHRPQNEAAVDVRPQSERHGEQDRVAPRTGLPLEAEQNVQRERDEERIEGERPEVHERPAGEGREAGRHRPRPQRTAGPTDEHEYEQGRGEQGRFDADEPGAG